MKRLSSILLLIPLLVACETEEILYQNDKDQATGTTPLLLKQTPYFESDIPSSIGLYAYDANASGAAVYNHIEFTYLNNLLTPVNENDYQYWKYTESLDIYAYAAYQSLIIDSSTNYDTAILDLSVLEDQSSDGNYNNCDLLYGSQSGVTNTNWNSNPKGIVFAHRLSKIDINLKRDATLTDAEINNASVEILNTQMNASFNLKTNALTISNNTTKDITPNLTTAKNGFIKSMQAIVLPQTMTASSTILKITCNNQPYFYKLEADLEFEQGKAYAFDITLSRNEIILNVNETAWINGGGGAGERIKYKVGDYFPIPDDPNTASGLVYEITNNGYNGKVIALTEAITSWINVSWIQTDTPDCWSDTDGKSNVNQAINHTGGLDNFHSRYPAFSQCYNYGASLGEAGLWYLPAINELSDLRNAYNSYGQGQFNNRITAAKGDPILSLSYYSSTEGSAIFIRGAYTLNMGNSVGKELKTKQTSFRSRAIRTFSN